MSRKYHADRLEIGLNSYYLKRFFSLIELSGNRFAKGAPSSKMLVFFLPRCDHIFAFPRLRLWRCISIRTKFSKNREDSWKINSAIKVIWAVKNWRFFCDCFVEGVHPFTDEIETEIRLIVAAYYDSGTVAFYFVIRILVLTSLLGCE